MPTCTFGWLPTHHISGESKWEIEVKHHYIEDIYFLGVNTKYISLSVLKASEISWVRSMSVSDGVNSQDEIYLVFAAKKLILFLFYTFYRLHAMAHPL